MVFKTLVPAEKDAEERESPPSRKKPRGFSQDKKSRVKPKSEPPASLGAFNYFGKNINDPRVKLKLWGLTPRNQARETSAGVQEFVKHMTSILRDNKYSFTDEDSQESGRPFYVDENKYKNGEKLTQSRDASLSKSSREKPNSEKVDFPKKNPENKPKIYKNESPERKPDSNSGSRSPDGRKTQDLPERTDGKKETPQRKSSDTPQKETLESQKGVEPERKKRFRRSEIPLLKNRQKLDKRTEVVSLMMKKSLKENDSTSSIDFCPNNKCPPVDELNAVSEMEIVLKANDSSPKIVDTGDGVQKKSSNRRTPESPEEKNLDACLKRSDTPLSLEMSESTAGGRKSAKSSRARTLDLEKVKTSSFTVLRKESDTYSRLETFHQQNITAKETARAEIAIKASKLLVMTSKTSFSSVKLKKSMSAGVNGKDSKTNSKKSKKHKNDTQESIFQKKGSKISETPHLDICKEIIATGKVGCLTPKKANKEKNNKNVKCEKKNPDAVGSKKNPVSKINDKAPLKNNGGYSKKNKVEKSSRNAEKTPKKDSRPVAVNNESNESKENALKSSGIQTSPETADNAPENEDLNSQNKILEEILDREVKLTARELASLVVTGTALNFDDIQAYEKQPEVDKIKLEIKIEVASEEDATDSDLVECESNGDVSGPSLDWLLINKIHNEKQVHENANVKGKTSQENLSPCDTLTDEVKSTECKWEPESTLQGHRSLSSIKRRANFKTIINLNGVDKKTTPEPGDQWSFCGDRFNSSMFFQNDNKPDTKVRSGLTRSSNRDDKIFDDPAALKLKRRNSEPYSFRGFIWKRADVTSTKSLKPSVSSMASSLRHLNTDEMDDFIFWEAVPQKLTSCWEMSLYHFKRPWSVLSCSVFRDNRRSNTPGLILETLRSGGLTNMRRPYLYSNDRINYRKGNIFDVEPSISQKNIDIRNWLAALNFTAPVSNNSDIISEGTFRTSSIMDTQKQASPKRRNVIPQFRLTDKVPEKKISNKEKLQRSDKWNVNDMDDLKELIRRESGGYVTKEQYVLSELINPRSTVAADDCTHSTEPEKVSGKTGHRNLRREEKKVKIVETSCQSEPQEKVLPQDDSPTGSMVGTMKKETVTLPPEINIWKYLFLFTLMFIIVNYSLGSKFATLLT